MTANNDIKVNSSVWSDHYDSWGTVKQLEPTLVQVAFDEAKMPDGTRRLPAGALLRVRVTSLTHVSDFEAPEPDVNYITAR